MREILFRGNRIDNGEWVEGFFIGKTDPLLEVSYAFIVTQHGKDSFVTWHKVDPSTVGQYTGLQDKNGKRIWEGDILEIVGHAWGVNGNYAVEWSDVSHCWCLSRSDDYHYCHFTFSALNGFESDAEVIGNIHDNPELLDGGADLHEQT